MKTLNNSLGWLGWMSLALVATGSVTALWIVPPDGAMGDVQRLMYVHVPTAWLAMLAFFIVFLMSVLYLVQRKPACHLPAQLRVLGPIDLAHAPHAQRGDYFVVAETSTCF